MSMQNTTQVNREGEGYLTKCVVMVSLPSVVVGEL